MLKTAVGLASGGPEAVASALGDTIVRGLAGLDPAFVFVFASTEQPLAEVTRPLEARFPRAMIVGATTAGEFTHLGDAKGATSAFALAGDVHAFAGIGTALASGPEAALRQALGTAPDSVAGFPHRTVFLLLDPLAGVSEEVTAFAAKFLGPDTAIAGGAAGDDLHMEAPAVSLGARVETDAVVALTIFTQRPVGIGVAHGHRPLSIALRVTKAAGNQVAQIVGRSAWDVWRDHTRAHASRTGIDVYRLTPEEEGAFLLRYEAALADDDERGEGVIRAPLSRNAEGVITFAGAIREGSFIRITESGLEGQIGSAREAARRARAQMGRRPVAGALVFDCICRQLILGSQFNAAIESMTTELGGAPLAGFETYGEIGTQAGAGTLFHNTTSVVVAFPAD